MVKLQAIKEGLNSLSIDGKQYIVDKENLIEVDLGHVEDALSHGFELFVEEVKETVKRGKK